MTHIAKKLGVRADRRRARPRTRNNFPLIRLLAMCCLLAALANTPAAAPAFLNFTNSVLLGGAGNDDARAVVISADGVMFVAGSFAQVMTTTAGSLTSAGNLDGYLMRVSPAGAVDWAVRFGGASTDQATVLAIDADGNLCVGGFFAGTATFPGANQLQAQAGNDGFYASFATNGTIRWLRQISGSGEEFVRGVAAIPSGGVKVLGQYTQTAMWNGNALASNGVVTILLGTVDADGNPVPASLVSAGANNSNISLGRLAVAGDGSALVAGVFEGTVLGRTSASGSDLFVAKFSPAGALSWVFNGGSGNLTPLPLGLALASDDTATVGVGFQGTVVFNGKIFSAPTVGSWLGRISSSGTLTSSNFLNNAQVTAIAAGRRGVVHVAANYSGTVVAGAESLTAADGTSETLVASYLPGWELGGISRVVSSPAAVVLDAVAGADDGVMLAGYGGQSITVDGTAGATGGGVANNLLLARLAKPDYRLMHSRLGTTLRVTFPAYYFDATWQTNALLPGTWGDAPAAVVSQPGVRTIDVEMTAPERYFRLKRPAN